MSEWRLSEQIDAFRSPSIYPHEVNAQIEILQTHISFVVLTGPYAYKLKKSVDMGFLDFTSLERRRHFCTEELRLNRAFAPELYEDLVEVRWDGQRISLDPSASGEIVE